MVNRQKRAGFLCESPAALFVSVVMFVCLPQRHRATQSYTENLRFRYQVVFSVSTPTDSFHLDRFHDHSPTGAAARAGSIALFHFQN